MTEDEFELARQFQELMDKIRKLPEDQRHDVLHRVYDKELVESPMFGEGMAAWRAGDTHPERISFWQQKRMTVASFFVFIAILAIIFLVFY